MVTSYIQWSEIFVLKVQCMSTLFFLIIVGNGSYLHQSEYQGGVSSWNFDIVDLKAQESLNQHSF